MVNHGLHECFHKTTIGRGFTTKVWNGFLIGVVLGNTNEYGVTIENFQQCNCPNFLQMNIGTIGKLQAFILHILPCDALQSINI